MLWEGPTDRQTDYCSAISFISIGNEADFLTVFIDFLIVFIYKSKSFKLCVHVNKML